MIGASDFLMYRTRDDLVNFIRQRLDATSQNMKSASEAAGYNHAYLRQFLEDGKPAKLREEARAAFARVLLCDADDLKVGEVGESKGSSSVNRTLTIAAEDHPNVRPGPTGPAPDILGLPLDVPNFGSAAAGPDGRFDMNGGEPLNYVRRPPFLFGVKGAYAVYCEGTSMAPLWEPGDSFYVYPGHPVRIGDYVLIELKPTEKEPNPGAYVKRLVRRTADKLIVEQINPQEQMTIPLARVKEPLKYVCRPNDLLKL
jgi:phage repressor protein C with HTH and peptisase S24 domain